MIDPPPVNWQAIHGSDVWHEHIRPWLAAYRQDLLEEGPHSMTAEEFQRWRGAAQTVQALLDMPEEMLEAERLEREQEKNEKARRDGDRTGIRERIARLNLFGRP